jgi:hypothetical protein
MIFNDDSKNDSKNKFILYEYNSESKEAYGLINGKFSYRKKNTLKKLHVYYCKKGVYIVCVSDVTFFARW